jgi:hypothetical protein
VNATLDELYLRWLYAHISPVSVKNPARTYWLFAKQLFDKEFVWFIPNDDNRIADGLALRDEFLDDCNFDEVDSGWMGLGCSMLEMLIALSRRLSFLIEREPRDCFWLLVEHLEGLTDYSDKQYKNNPDMALYVDTTLDRIIWRTYHYSGSGGLFPLRDPDRDQRTTEIWTQMSAWVLEHDVEGG